MKKINKKVITLGIASFMLVAGASAYASGTISELFPTVESEHQIQAKQVENRLNQSWAKGKEVLERSTNANTFALNSARGSVNNDLSDWTFGDITNLDELLSSFSDQEKASFLEAFYGKERQENLEQGDYMSAVLLSPNKEQAIVYWEKANGNFITLDMKTKSDNSWFVDEVKLQPAQ
ncbi:hypothetical protein ACMX2M_03900 [Paenibacillus polymyxa]